MNADVTAGLFTLLGVIIGVVGTVFLAPRIREQFKLREIYLAPFRKWCADFYGELDEFYERYLSSSVKRNNYSDVQIIDDWRALHEVVMDGPKWLARVKKEDKEIAKNFRKLLGTIDRYWHKFEEKYNVRLKNRFDIITLEATRRRDMANALWARKNIWKGIDKEAILTYLWKQIP
jgi:ABC-type Fe3+/spermidine/putrescine transport system ATPase subunit